jgi:hypothetical protein
MPSAESRVAAQTRNPAKEMRFPASREGDGNAPRCRQPAEVVTGDPRDPARLIVQGRQPTLIVLSRSLRPRLLIALI